MKQVANHTLQENFIPLRAGMLAGKTKIQIIADHFGIEVSDIRFVEVTEDVCHLGMFVTRLSVFWREAGAARPRPLPRMRFAAI